MCDCDYCRNPDAVIVAYIRERMSALLLVSSSCSSGTFDSHQGEDTDQHSTDLTVVLTAQNQILQNLQMRDTGSNIIKYMKLHRPYLQHSVENTHSQTNILGLASMLVAHRVSNTVVSAPLCYRPAKCLCPHILLFTSLLPISASTCWTENVLCLSTSVRRLSSAAQTGA